MKVWKLKYLLVFEKAIEPTIKYWVLTCQTNKALDCSHNETNQITH